MNFSGSGISFNHTTLLVYVGGQLLMHSWGMLVYLSVKVFYDRGMCLKMVTHKPLQ